MALFVKNSLNVDNTIENMKFYNKKLRTLTLSVTSKFEELNGKFNILIEDAKRRVENQIAINKSKFFYITKIILDLFYRALFGRGWKNTQ